MDFIFNLIIQCLLLYKGNLFSYYKQLILSIVVCIVSITLTLFISRCEFTEQNKYIFLCIVLMFQGIGNAFFQSSLYGICGYLRSKYVVYVSIGAGCSGLVVKSIKIIMILLFNFNNFNSQLRFEIEKLQNLTTIFLIIILISLLLTIFIVIVFLNKTYLQSISISYDFDYIYTNIIKNNINDVYVNSTDKELDDSNYILIHNNSSENLLINKNITSKFATNINKDNNNIITKKSFRYLNLLNIKNFFIGKKNAVRVIIIIVFTCMITFSIYPGLLFNLDLL